MKKVLVTGGCGVIGRHICSGLLKKNCAVIAVDKEECNYNTGKLNYTFVQADPTDKNTYGDIFENEKIDIVVHAACTVDNDFGSEITEKEMEISRQCDKFIYRYALQEKVEKFILLSTDQLYDFPKSREPIREDNDLRIKTNYSMLKYASEKAFVSELQHYREVMGCIIRFAPVYTLNYTDNLVSKITDPRDGTYFVYGKGQYGFQFCCVHNLVDFILCFVNNVDDITFAGTYNVSDKLLITAADIITFMREKHTLGTVLQKSPPVGTITKFKGMFGISKEEKTLYRYLDLSKVENNNMLDITKAAKFAPFRWNLENTK